MVELELPKISIVVLNVLSKYCYPLRSTMGKEWPSSAQSSDWLPIHTYYSLEQFLPQHPGYSPSSPEIPWKNWGESGLSSWKAEPGLHVWYPCNLINTSNQLLHIPTGLLKYIQNIFEHSAPGSCCSAIYAWSGIYSRWKAIGRGVLQRTSSPILQSSYILVRGWRPKG